MDSNFEQWLKDKPKKIQDLAHRYPPTNKYAIRDGAPYTISCSETIVSLYAYLENGEVMVIVEAKHKKQSAIEREKEIVGEWLQSEEGVKKINESNILTMIDPQWLTPIIEN
jgi:hypothetical protein